MLFATLKENVDFLTEAAQSFHSHGHSEDACFLCHMDSAAQSSPQLQAVELEILGSMKQPDRIWEFINTVNDLFSISYSWKIWQRIEIYIWHAVCLYTIIFYVCNIFQNYGGDMASPPLPVQVALIHALVLADKYKTAMEVLKKLSNSEK